MTEKFQMLIDFNSPKTPLESHYLDKISVFQKDDISWQDNNNPFDSVAHVIESQINKQDSFHTKSEVSDQLNEENGFISETSMGQNPSNISLNVHKNIIENEKGITENCETKLLQLKLDGDVLNDFNYLSAGEPIPSENNSEINISLTMSNNNDIKDIIAKRVNSCIEKALNSSQSHSDLRCISSAPKYERRAISASNLGSSFRKDNSKCSIGDILLTPKKTTHNSSLPFFKALSNDFTPYNKSFIKYHHASNDSLPCTMNVSTDDKNNWDDHEVLDEVCREARKLADTFKELANNSTVKGKSEPLEDCEDIMSIEPMWDLPNFSDDDDDIGLPSLKLFHVPRQKFIEKKLSGDSDALIRFKSRHKASTTPQEDEINKDNNQETQPTHSESSVDDKPSTNTEVADSVGRTSGLKIKSKKPVADMCKKGPLKAMIPLQKMTRRIAEKLSSPLRSLHGTSNKDMKISQQAIHTKLAISKKDSSFLSSTPVAASTPQKQLNSKISSPNVDMPKLRLSRADNNSSGSLKRSSSVNSRLSTNSPNNSKGINSVNAKGSNKQTLSRPKTAPSQGTNGRALSDTQNTIVGAKQNIRRPLNQMLSAWKRPGGATVPDKENQVIQT